MYPRRKRTATADRRPSYLTLVRAAGAAKSPPSSDRIAKGNANTKETDAVNFQLAKTDVQHVLDRVVFTLRHKYGTGDDGVYFVLSVLDTTFGWSGRFGAEWMASARQSTEVSTGAA